MTQLGECYICTLESAPLSPCNCKNMYLHNNCQIKLMQEKGQKCSICLEEFNNIQVFTKVKYCYSSETKTTFFMMVLDIGMGCLGIYEIVLYLILEKNHLILLVLGGVFLINSFTFGIFINKTIQYLHNTNQFYEITNEKIINLKI